MQANGSAQHETRDYSIPAADGYPLAATEVCPARPLATIVIGSATAVPRRYYARYARFLAREGFRVITFDYRGIGDSRPASLRGFPGRMRDWGLVDLPGVLDWAGQTESNLPLLVIGHSVGGQMFGLAGNNDRVTALLTVASQSAEWRLWSGMGRLRIATLYYVLIPTLVRLVGHFPSRWVGMGEDLPPGVALDWSEIGRSKGYIRGALGDEAARRFDNFKGTMLAYSFSDDWYAPHRAVEGLLSFYGAAQKSHRHLDPADVPAKAIGHFGFFRGEFEETLWRETSQWLKEAAGLPDQA